MKHFLLKLNHAIEIGAANAYFGHFQRTGDAKIFTIAMQEVMHEGTLKKILKCYGHKSNFILDKIFYIIGSTVGFLCLVSPEFLLDIVAQTMEKFAIVNYRTLSKMYPKHSETLMTMYQHEVEHEIYFRTKKRD